MSDRSKIAWLIPVAVSALAAFALYFFLAGDDPADEVAVGPEAATSADSTATGGALPDASSTSRGATSSAEVSGDRAEAPRGLAREEVAGAEGEAVAPVWVAGRVAFGFELPEDEELRVLSVEESLGSSARRRVLEAAWDEEEENDDLRSWVPVEDDGSFRIAVPGDAPAAHLMVAGRYVYAGDSVRVRLPLEQEEVVLSGHLGAWITGALSAPSSSEEVSLEGVEVEVGPDITASFDALDVGPLSYSEDSETDEDGRFEFRGVPTSMTRALLVRHEELAGRLMLGLELEAGEHRELDVRLQEGATLRGRVLGPDGQGLADCDVDVTLLGQLGPAVDELRETKTDASGAFVLEHVFTGRRVQINAKMEGLRGGRLRLSEKLRDGQEVGDLEVVVEAGETLRGRVTYPDGLPAEGAEVEVGLDITKINPQMIGARAAFMRDVEVETAADGTFVATGLGEGPWKVEVELDNEEEGDHPGRWSGGASTEDAGTFLDVELAGLCEMRGRLATASGRPLEAFRVELTLQGSGGMMGIGAKRESENFDAPEAGGAFTMDDVPPGLWEARVTAEGFSASEVLEVELPQPAGSEAPVFDLVPSAAAAGVVLDTFGDPMPGAEVSVELDLNDRISGVFSGGAPSVTTDHEGNFLLTGLEPGSNALVAKATGFASSEPQQVELVAGETSEGLELTLRVGGSLAGQILGDDGEPAVGKMVVVQSMPTYAHQRILTSDADGGFHAEHLEPGRWQIVAMGNPMTGEVDVEGGDDLNDMLADMKMDTVEIREGEEAWVLLGEPPANPIEVFGRVVHGGEPVTGSFLSFIPEGAAGLGDMKIVTCQDDGSFRVTLDQRGPYLVNVQHTMGAGQENRVELRRDIPEDVASHNMTLELPGGGISGRVVDADGRPAAGCRVSLSVDEGIVFGTLMGGHYTEIQTDGDGNYEIDYLAPGRYRVAAGGATLGGLLGDDSVAGRVVKGGIEVRDGQVVRGVDFRLSKPGVLRGLVIGADGQPVPKASVFVRDAAGRTLDRVSFVTTDSSGRFEYGGVAEGLYTFCAKKGELVSHLSEPIEVQSGKPSEGQVMLDEGTVLIVSVIDKAGKEIDARLTIRDREGREMAGMQSVEEMMALFGDEFSTMEQRVGPLPVGKYRVRRASTTAAATTRTSTSPGGRLAR